jgi:ATP synthase protein I
MVGGKRWSWAALWREALTATTLGWELALPIFGGVLLGYYLDRWLGTGHIFTLGLMVFGVGAGFYNISRFSQRFESRRRQIERDESDRADADEVEQ